MENVIPTGQKPRKYNAFDNELVLRNAAAAAITTVGANFAAPDYESALITLGPGQFVGKVVLNNFTVTLAGDNTNLVHCLVIGVDSTDANKRCILGGLTLGATAKTGNDAAFLVATGAKDIEICFQTALFGRVFDQIKLAIVTTGTATAFTFDCEAYITRCEM